MLGLATSNLRSLELLILKSSVHKNLFQTGGKARRVGWREKEEKEGNEVGPVKKSVEYKSPV